MRRERLLNRHVEPHRELVRVVLVVREAEAVIEQQELVRTVSVAVEDLIARFNRLPRLIYQGKVGLIFVLLRIIPIELFIRFIAVSTFPRLLGGVVVDGLERRRVRSLKLYVLVLLECPFCNRTKHIFLALPPLVSSAVGLNFCSIRLLFKSLPHLLSEHRLLIFNETLKAFALFRTRMSLTIVIFLLSIVVLLKLLANAWEVPKLRALEAPFQLLNGSEFAILREISPAKATFDVKRAIFVPLILLRPEAKRVVVHELGLREVLAGFVRLEVHCFVQNFLDHRDVRMIVIVRHWNHGSRRQAPAEAPSANLRVELVEEGGVVLGRRENARIQSQDV